MNDGKPLIIKRKEEAVINDQKVVKFKDRNIFPEYYLIRVEKYHNIVKKKIDEWIYLIKNDQVSAGSTSKNIDKAAEKLAYINMSETERKRYERYLINLHREIDIIDTAKEDGEKAKAQNMAIIMLQDNMPISLIAKYTGLTEEDITALSDLHK